MCSTSFVAFQSGRGSVSLLADGGQERFRGKPDAAIWPFCPNWRSEDWPLARTILGESAFGEGSA